MPDVFYFLFLMLYILVKGFMDIIEELKEEFQELKNINP